MHALVNSLLYLDIARSIGLSLFHRDEPFELQGFTVINSEVFTTAIGGYAEDSAHHFQEIEYERNHLKLDHACKPESAYPIVKPGILLMYHQ